MLRKISVLFALTAVAGVVLIRCGPHYPNRLCYIVPSRCQKGKVIVVNLEKENVLSEGYIELVEVLNLLAPKLDFEVVHYTQFNKQFVDTHQPVAIILGPQGTPWWEYDLESLKPAFEAVRQYDGPVLGICGGHQFLAMAYGGKVQPVACDPNHQGYKGCAKEYGYIDVDIEEHDKLFFGFGDKITVLENHYECVTKLPKDAQVLASTTFCPVQSFKIKGTDKYGVQFHPERFTPAYDDGLAVLRNFFLVTRICTL